MIEFFHVLIYADNKDITWWAMSIRGILFFILGIILIKIGGKRMFGQEGAFDIVISIVLGALMAKGIAGNAQFIPTIITTTVMVIFYNLISRITYYNRFMEKIIKGNNIPLMKNGKKIIDAMESHRITDDDILEVQRMKNHSTKSNEIEEAYLEANGKISVILKGKEQ